MSASNGKVSNDQRYTPSRPCPICGSHDRARRGQGERCHGYLAGSGKFAFCARVESDETIESPAGTLFKHRLEGDHPAPPPRPSSRPRKGYRTPQEAARRLGRGLGRIAGHWPYHDASGRPCLGIYRFEADDGTKTYRPVHRGGDDLWYVGDPEGPLPLYRLPELAKLADADLVVVNEGERPADAARSLGMVATTPAHGAQSPHRTDWRPLAGKSVVILPDNDPPGREFALAVIDLLAKLDPAPTIKVVDLPGIPEKGDIVEWIAAGGTHAGLLDLIEQAPDVELPRTSASGDGRAPTATAAARDEGKRPVFCNYRVAKTEQEGEGEGEKTRREAIDQPELVKDLQRLTSGWPRLVGNVLFAHDGGDADVREFTSPDKLLAWIGGHAKIVWGEGPSCVSQRRLFEALKLCVPKYEAIERHPHFPAIDGIYYACSPTDRHGDGMALSGLLDLFTPATPADRELIRAFIYTLFWGGPPGKRPMFLAEGPEDDSRGGRGVGKSDLFSILAGLVGGTVSNISARDDISAITKRIINDKARKRCVLLDNVKAERFSWGDFESLITGATVGGWLNYVGDEIRPNLFTYCMTINGASLSEDLAQRTVMIRLDRPKSYDLGHEAWSDVAGRYISENRAAIVADVVTAFAHQPEEIRSLQRWASWTHAVLARCNAPHTLQNVIIDRQQGINDDLANANEFGRFLALKLEGEFGEKASGLVAWISSDVLVPLVAEFTGDKITSLNVSKKINRFRPPQLTKKDRDIGKGWRWVGIDADPALKPREWVHAKAAAAAY